MEIDFNKYRALQYCENKDCQYHDQIGSGNICILSRKNNQVYCNGCKNRWVLTKGTFFYDLRHDFSLIIRVLKDLSEGKGQRAIQRTDGIIGPPMRFNYPKKVDSQSCPTRFANK